MNAIEETPGQPDRRMSVSLTPTEMTQAFLSVYEGLPGEVVSEVESHRFALTRDLIEHLVAINELLTPHGKFKAWCLAAGIDPDSAYWIVSSHKRRLAQLDRPRDSNTKPDYDHGHQIAWLFSRIIRHTHFEVVNDPRVRTWAIRKFRERPELSERARKFAYAILQWSNEAGTVGLVEADDNDIDPIKA